MDTRLRDLERRAEEGDLQAHFDLIRQKERSGNVGITPAFLTGSRVYGTPRLASDIDLVVLADTTVIDKLVEVIRFVNIEDYQYADCVSIRAGRLNLLFCTSVVQYEKWKIGTAELIEKKPVTKEKACEKFNSLRQY